MGDHTVDLAQGTTQMRAAIPAANQHRPQIRTASTRSVQENIVAEVVGERRPRSISVDRRQTTMTADYKRISVLFTVVAETGS